MVLVIGTTVMGGAWLYVESLKDTIKNQAVDLQIANGTIAVEKEKKVFADEQLVTSQERTKELDAKIVVYRRQAESMRAIFNDHDFQMLMEKKPQLITNRMIKATEKVFKDLEDASK